VDQVTAARRTRRALILLVVLSGWGSVSCGQIVVRQQEKRMEHEKRAPVPVADPVSRDGTRYEEVQFEKSDGLDQNSGYIAAVDQATGKRRWVLKVYEVRYDNDLEADLQDVFIKKLELSADGKTLYVTNEEERRFAVHLDTRTVVEIKS
jgi:hypothetical protein